jgi:hypothetical protein
MDRIRGIAVHASDGILSAPQLAIAPADTRGILVVKPGFSTKNRSPSLLQMNDKNSLYVFVLQKRIGVTKEF